MAKRVHIVGVDNGTGYPVLYGDDDADDNSTIDILSEGVWIEKLGVTGPSADHAGILVAGDRSTIKDCVIFGNREGILVSGSDGNTIVLNDLSGNFIGIDLEHSRYSTIAENRIHDNSFHGIKLNGSDNNSILKNIACFNSDDAIAVENASDYNVISENNVSCNALSSVEFENKNAIYVYGSDGNVISDNLMMLNGGTVARDNGARIYRLGDAVQLKETKDTVVSDNVMIDDHYAVWVDDSENVSVTGNAASGEYYNIILENSRDCFVADNVLTKSGRNLRLLNAHRCTLRNNTMSGGMYDITLTDSWYNTIENCTWSNSAPGYQSLWLSNSSFNVLSGNTAHNNSEGIWLENSVNNRLYLNDFLDGVGSASPGNYWNTSRPETYQYLGKTYTGYLGNRYGDYSGSDTDLDGIGELSYTLNGAADQYPLIQSSKNYLKPASTVPLYHTPGRASGVDGSMMPAETDAWQWWGDHFKTWIQYRRV